MSGPGLRKVVDFATLRAEAQAEISNDWTPVEAARLVLARFAPDESATAELLVYGLSQVANNDLARRRDRAARPAVVAVLAPGGPSDTPESEDILGIGAATADGSMRPWGQWSATDWRAWEQVCAAQVDGWFKRQEGAGQIATLLEKARVTRAADLPAAQLTRVRAIIEGFRA